MSLPNPYTRCATELDSFREYWCNRSLVNSIINYEYWIYQQFSTLSTTLPYPTDTAQWLPSGSYFQIRYSTEFCVRAESLMDGILYKLRKTVISTGVHHFEAIKQGERLDDIQVTQ